MGMKNRHRFTLAAIVASMGVSLACGGKTGGDAGAGSGVSGACDDYFQTLVLGPCGSSAPLPPDDVARLRSRLNTVCTEALALPGTGLTSAGLEACISAVQSQGCSVLDQPIGPCRFATGSLAVGSPCTSSVQCASGVCTSGELTADGGQTVCGTCAATAAVGQPCGGSQDCAANAVCSNSTCVAYTSVGLGASCGQAVQCNPGLYCSEAATCTAQGGAGTSCVNDSDCTPPLVCPPSNTALTCQSPGGAGAPCEISQDCASGLVCGEISNICGTATFATAGQACSEYVGCEVGACPFAGGTIGGVCPTVIADGQPCDETDATTTCDTFASCEGGTCVLGFTACP
jgi:hypothetical protein